MKFSQKSKFLRIVFVWLPVNLFILVITKFWITGRIMIISLMLSHVEQSHTYHSPKRSTSLTHMFYPLLCYMIMRLFSSYSADRLVQFGSSCLCVFLWSIDHVHVSSVKFHLYYSWSLRCVSQLSYCSGRARIDYRVEIGWRHLEKTPLRGVL